ncbi:MAG TPA: type IV pilin [Methanobacterium sp.]|nr:type IV pilin [Methanobacterium sp.]
MEGQKRRLLCQDCRAVSPVIGVILMVAITVILAAAIGSSVFSHGTAKSAPQANFDMKAGDLPGTSTAATIKVEHLGGDPVHFEKASITKVVASVNGGDSYEIEAADDATTNSTVEGLGTMGVGDIRKLDLTATSGTFPTVATGNTVNIKFIDTQTNQLICDKDVRF